MKKHLLSAMLCLCLLIGAGAQATAVESDAAGSDSIDIVVNSAAIDAVVPVQVYDQITYVAYLPVVTALYPTATAAWENGSAIVTAPGLSMTITPGLPYLVANGRYLYMPQGVKSFDGNIFVAARTLATALGAGIAWDGANSAVVFTAGAAPIAAADAVFSDDTVYWLSHIINAESGNQPLTGKIAVGNVVLNRVASSQFPDTVYGVVFQRHQFTPVSNGTISLTPNAESVAAAKLALDGANTVGDSLYFLNPNTARSSWAARNRPYVATIGQHAFYA